MTENRSVLLDWMIVSSFILAAFLIRLPIIIYRQFLLPGDEVMFGLMAKHILQGEFPIYYWGQSYLGVVEAYVTALLSLPFGMNGITVQLGGFFFYTLFLIVNYFLIKRMLGWVTSIFTSIFLIVAPIMMTELSVRALGGYSELLFLGALSLWFWLKVFHDGDRRFLLPLGFLLGFSLWVNSLFIAYLLAFALLSFFWKKGFDERVKQFHPARIFFLKSTAIPIWFKIPYLVVNAVVFFYLIHEIIIFFHGGFDHKILGIAFKEPAFQWKGVKKILCLILGQYISFSIFACGWKEYLERVRSRAGFLLGFVLGYLPAIGYNLFGGEGYRLLHKSGATPAHALGAKFQTLFVDLVTKTLWGVEGGLGIFVFVLFISGLFYFLWTHRRGVKESSFFFIFLGASVLAIALASSLVADRYLTPFYWVTAVAAGAFAAKITVKTKGIGVLILVPFLIFKFGVIDRYVQNLKAKNEDVRGLVEFLESKGIQGGWTDYDNAYRFNFYSNERIIFIPLVGMMRRPAYQEFVSKLNSYAIILPADSPNEKEYLTAHPDFKPGETFTFKTYRVFHLFK